MSGKRNIQDMYPLSPMQEGMLYQYLLDPGSPAYVVQETYRVTGPLDRGILQQAFNRLIRHYDILRTQFVHQKVKQPLQVVFKEKSADVDAHDIRSLPPEKQHAFIERFKAEDRVLGFDLKQGMLMRFTLLQTGEREFILVWCYHHIIMDGWCVGLFLNDLLTVYRHILNHEPVRLKPAIPYSRYIRWLEGKDLDAGVDYWKDYLQNFSQTTAIPPRHMVDPSSPYKPGSLSFRFNRRVSERAFQLANGLQTTVNTVLQTLWGILLARLNDTGDAVFGAIVSGRPPQVEGVEEILGVFINTVPVRITVDQNPRIRELIRARNTEASTAAAYEYLPLAQVQGPHPLKNRLFDHIMVFENFPPGQVVGAVEHQGEKIEVQFLHSFQQTAYPFNLILFPSQPLEAQLIFDRNRFAEKELERMMRRFEHLLAQAVGNPEIPVDDVEIVLPQERETLLTSLCRGEERDFQLQTVYSQFLDMAAKHPDAIALVAETSLSYSEFYRRCKRLSRKLRGIGVKDPVPVAVCCRRSVEMMLGIYGAIGAGAFYVPVDPDYPAERIDYMLRDSAAAVVLTTAGAMDNLERRPFWNGEIIVLDREDQSQAIEDRNGADHVPASDDPIYTIYTSGSTGNPKGALSSHESVANRLAWMGEELAIDRHIVFFQKTTFTFDVSVWEIFLPLIRGAQLVLARHGGEKDPYYLPEAIRRFDIGIIHFVPSMLAVFLEANGADAVPGCLDYCMCSGEALSSKLAGEFLEAREGNTRLFNLYGPTEAAVDVTMHEVKEGDTVIPIGKAVANTNLYVLDRKRRLMPTGIGGELYISGVQVGLGYLNRPQLSAGSFLEDTFIEDRRIYKTGDRCRMRADGTVEYIGRIDGQVKVRGFRIELGEIEHHLASHPLAREAAAAIHRDAGGDGVICGYVVMREGENGDFPGIQDWKSYLASFLPAYMIPHHVMAIPAIPLSPNGKCHRKALPKPGTDNMPIQKESIPNDPTHQRLAVLWAEVLDAGAPGLHDDFFVSGGDSIKSIRLLSAINKEFEAHLTLNDIQRHPTIGQLAQRLTQAEAGRRRAAVMKEILAQLEQLKADVMERGLLTADVDDVFPMSDIQKGMVFHAQQSRGSGMYHDQFLYRATIGELDIRRFKRALRMLAAKHPALRTAFDLARYREPLQWVAKEIEPVFDYHDLTNKKTAAGHRFIQDWLAEDRRRPFEIHEPPLWRASAFQISSSDVVLAIVFHHAILDGWSNASLIAELYDWYDRLAAASEDVSLPPLKHDSKMFVAEQLAESRDEGNLEFWRSELQEYKRLDFSGFAGEAGSPQQQYTAPLKRRLKERLERLAARRNTTLKTIGAAAYMAMLSMISYDNDICAGLVVNGRPQCEDGDKMLGCFLNTVPFRLRIGHEVTWEELIQATGSKFQEIALRQRLSFARIVKAAGESGVGENPFFDTIYNYIDFHVYGDLHREHPAKSAEESPPLQGFESTNTPFDLNLSATGGGLTLIANYSAAFIGPDHVERLIGYFKRALETMASDSKRQLSKTELMDPEEKDRLLRQWNDTARDFECDASLPALIDQQAEARPDHIALVFEDHILTYGELERSAARIAGHIRLRSVGNGGIVAIHCRRNLQLLAGMLGIWKAGCGYLPIDPDTPAQRRDYMLRDSAASLCLTIGRQDDVPDALDYSDPHQLEAGNPPVDQARETNDRTAYVIYTSGSTGKPKGVLVRRRAIVNRLLWMARHYGIGPEDIVLQKTTCTFDVSVWELFLPLISGGRLVLARPGGEKEPAYLYDAIKRFRVTTLHFVPSMLGAFLQSLRGALHMPSLKRVFASGEALTPPLAREFFGKTGETVELHNLYGPTEAAVDVSFHQVRAGESTIPIGRPVANTTLHIMDNHLRYLPVGAVGELYIGGVQLAAGYMNRPSLTGDTFVPHPSLSNESLYKTGDLCRRGPDGEIEFLGRVDHQVKVRGFRIELGEIESALLSHPAVAEAAVIAGGAGNNSLLAYIAGPQPPAGEELREFLSWTLPPYMVPSLFIPLDRLPKTQSGKIDRKRLPKPELSLVTAPAEIVPPRSRVEEAMVEVWQEILDLSPIGVTDNFFLKGGDSIKALQVVARLYPRGIDLQLQQLLKFPTIEALAEMVNSEAIQTIDQAPVTGSMGTTPIQRWFWSLDQKNPHHWNQSVMVRRTEGFDEEMLTAALKELLVHHDALRLVVEDGGRTMRFAAPEEVEPELQVLDVSQTDTPEADILRHANRVQAGIRLDRPPLLKAGLFKTTDGDHLLLAIHHLVVDGVSWRILLEDLAAAYQALMKGETVALPPKSHSFKDWGQVLKKLRDSEQIVMELEFWKAMLGREIDHLPEFDSRQESIGDDETQAPVEFELNETATKMLTRDFKRNFGGDADVVILSALMKTLNRFSGIRRLAITLEGHGRRDVGEGINLSRTVGWFTSLYPLVLDSEPDGDWASMLRRTRRLSAAVPNKGIGYGILRYAGGLSGDEREGLDYQPAVMFNYLGDFKPQAADAPFEFSNLPMGHTVDPANYPHHPLDITAVKVDGRLFFAVRFDRRRISNAQTKQFAAIFNEELLDLSGYFGTDPDIGLQAEDFPLLGHVGEKLDRLMAKEGGIEGALPLSAMQEAVLTANVMAYKTGADVELYTFLLEGDLDIEFFNKTWEIIFQRHAILRTSFHWKRLPQPVQLVRRNVELPLVIEDWSDAAPAQSQGRLEEFIRQEKHRGFREHTAPLTRLALFKTGAAEYRFVWSYQALLLDGWSRDIVLEEILRIYQSLAAGIEPSLPPTAEYADYIHWLVSQSQDGAGEFWRRELAGFRRSNSMNSLEIADKKEGFAAAETEIRLSKGEGATVRRMLGTYDLTLNTLIQGLWALCVNRVSGEDDILLGSLISARPPHLRGIELMAGNFQTILPLRVMVRGEDALLDFLKTIQERQLNIQHYQYATIRHIAGWADIDLSMVQEALYHRTIVFLNTPEGVGETGDPANIRIRRQASAADLNIPLRLYVEPRDEPAVAFHFDPNRYRREKLEGLLRALKRGMTRIDNLDAPIRVLQEEMFDDTEL
jgi:amino acid adenylation domain-containing protein/non-ribosomal peptide synthase protein (TIGR01720 family)